MKWTISYKNNLIEGDSFNEVFESIAGNKSLVSDLLNGAKFVGYREGARLLECGAWFIENKKLMYQAVSKQMKNKDGDII